MILFGKPALIVACHWCRGRGQISLWWLQYVGGDSDALEHHWRQMAKLHSLTHSLNALAVNVMGKKKNTWRRNLFLRWGTQKWLHWLTLAPLWMPSQWECRSLQRKVQKTFKWNNHKPVCSEVTLIYHTCLLWINDWWVPWNLKRMKEHSLNVRRDVAVPIPVILTQVSSGWRLTPRKWPAIDILQKAPLKLEASPRCAGNTKKWKYIALICLHQKVGPAAERTG